MRIAFFVNAFPIMSEAFIATAAADLIEAGHAVDIFGLGTDRPTGMASKAASRHGLLNRARNAETPKTMPERWSGLARASHDIVKHHGVLALPVFHPGEYRRSLIDLEAFYQARVLPRECNYDILHCHFGTLAEFVLKHRQAGRLSGKVVVHLRGYDISETVFRVGPHVFDRVWAEADRVIANCDHFRDRAIALGCPRNKIDVVGSGIDLANFPYRPPLPLDDGPIRLFLAGRLIERKGVHITLRAIAKLREAGLNLKLDVVGDGEERTALRALATELDLNDTVTFHGALGHCEIRTFLDRSHISLSPSMTSKYGGVDAPVNTIKEAMAVGVPVVATRHGGIPELVVEGETGTLAPENDVDGLADAIARMIDLAPRWPELTDAGRHAVEARYDLRLITPLTLASYRRAIGRNSAEFPTPCLPHSEKAAA